MPVSPYAVMVYQMTSSGLCNGVLINALWSDNTESLSPPMLLAIITGPSCGIHLNANPQEMLKIRMTGLGPKITNIKDSYISPASITLHWRHNGRDGVSNHQPQDCLLNHLFRRRSKKISKLRVTGLCAGNSPVADEFPAQMASNAESVSIWWRSYLS